MPILIDNIDILQSSISKVFSKITSVNIAYVILPDHFHLLFDPKGEDFTKIMQKLKMSFAMKYLKNIPGKKGRVWQHRYWDHIIRDDEDYNKHLDYIHYNPVKHGYVNSPFDWEFSSIDSFRDIYSPDWGSKEFVYKTSDFGE